MDKKHLLLIIILILFLIAALSYFYLASPALSPSADETEHEKQIHITLHEDGTSEEKILWKINVKETLSYIPPGEWGLQIPKKAESIKVKDPYQELDFEIEPRINHDFLKFQNSKNIYQTTDYFFEITYTVRDNPVVFEQNYFYERTLTRFPADSKFSLAIAIPENSELVFSSKIPESQNPLKYNLEKGETITISLKFEILEPFLSPALTTVITKHYEALVPEQYKERYELLLGKADNGVDFIESLYGFNSPDKWKIKTIKYGNSFENEDGFYLGDRTIGLKPTYLLKTEKEALYILLHETVHGFNSESFDDSVSNNWWEEGTAQYVAYSALESINYDTQDLKQKNLDLTQTCKDYDKSFIATWSPNKLLQNNPKINCNGEETDLISLGYAHSYHIIDTIVQLHSQEIFKKFYSATNQLQIEFSSEHATLNNQMNLVLSEAAGEELTTLLNSLGLQLDSLEKAPKGITGLPIFSEDESKINVKILLIIATVILLAIVTYWLFKKSGKKN